MKTVNFLPLYYQNQLRQRRASRLHGVVLTGLAVAVAGGAFAARAHYQKLVTQRNSLKQFIAADRGSTTLQHDQRQLLTLNRLRMASATIGQPLPDSDLLQQILDAMPAHTALRQLSLHMTRRLISLPNPPPKHATPHYQFAMQVSLTAVAPTQQAVNQCIEKLGRNALFGNMHFAVQPAIVRRRMVRQFKLRFRVHVNRLYGLRVANASLADAQR